ncbi:GNAT family N-acetyltransferase [Pelagibius sp.]|uniref:GNAT family N-acetyltransferase n=1 Tax=Pelagibius sp. TaxID=1931238 RepID=UPI00261EF15B|nr:GNAT family N-acetyltransferase [Pelagibius sp.]
MPKEPLPSAHKRIVLRRLCPGDLAAFQAYRCDPAVGRFQGWQAMSDAEARAFLADVNSAALLQPGRWDQIAIALASDDRLIGDIGLCVAEDAREAEIGFTLALSAQGQGFAHEAVTAALRLVFAQTAVERIVGITDTRNLSSLRLMERLGMEKIRTQQVVFQGEPCTEDVFAMTRGQAASEH